MSAGATITMATDATATDATATDTTAIDATTTTIITSCYHDTGRAIVQRAPYVTMPVGITAKSEDELWTLA